MDVPVWSSNRRAKESGGCYLGIQADRQLGLEKPLSRVIISWESVAGKGQGTSSRSLDDRIQGWGTRKKSHNEIGRGRGQGEVDKHFWDQELSSQSNPEHMIGDNLAAEIRNPDTFRVHSWHPDMERE